VRAAAACVGRWRGGAGRPAGTSGDSPAAGGGSAVAAARRASASTASCASGATDHACVAAGDWRVPSMSVPSSRMETPSRRASRSRTRSLGEPASVAHTTDDGKRCARAHAVSVSGHIARPTTVLAGMAATSRATVRTARRSTGFPPSRAAGYGGVVQSTAESGW
jgi:hypothetical protein